MSRRRKFGSQIIIIILALVILLGVVTSCSAVQQTQAFEKLETEPANSDAGFLPEETTIESEDEKDSIETTDYRTYDWRGYDIPIGDIAETGKKTNPAEGAETTGTTVPTEPTPSPTPKPLPVLSFGSGSYSAPYTIRVFLDKQRIIIYGTNSQGQEVPFRSMVTSTGVSSKRTPQTGEKGYFTLTARSGSVRKNGAPWVRFSLIGDTPTYHQYARQFRGTDIKGRNIGGNYFFHSTTYKTRYDNSSLVKNTYNKLGRTASSGCIRLNVADAKFIYGLPYGTKVKVLSSSSGYNLNVGGLPKYTIKNHNGWDPYDPDPRNPYGTLTAPSISGPNTLALDEGYAAAESTAFKLSGNPSPKVTLSGNTGGDKIVWDKSSNKLKIAAGLEPGNYEVILTAAGAGDSATLKFILTVKANPTPTPTPTTTTTQSTTTTPTKPPTEPPTSTTTASSTSSESSTEAPTGESSKTPESTE